MMNHSVDSAAVISMTLSIMSKRISIVFLFAANLARISHGFRLPSLANSEVYERNVSTEAKAQQSEEQMATVSRRDLFGKTGAFALGALTFLPKSAIAAGSPPTKEDLDRIKTGHDQIEYLLNNFEKATTVCRVSAGL